MSDNSALGISVLALTQAITVYHQFLPPLTEIRKTDVTDTTGRNDVRIGEAASFTLTLGIGAILSTMSRSKEPFIISVISAVALIGIYEYVLGVDAS